MPDTAKPTLIGVSATPTINIPAEALGTPGARAMLHIIPQFKDRRIPDEGAFEDNNQRAFAISGRLSKEPLVIGQTGHLKGDFDQNDGDCYLMAPPGANKIRFDTQWGHFHVRKNIAGELSLIEFECSAINAYEARTKFIEAVNPALDHLSYLYNIAIFVTTIRVVDIVHNSTHIESVAPYRRQIIADSMNQLYIEMKPVYSMYREAKNANSDFYRFLCFYKIMEGLLGRMRANAFTRAKAAGVTLTSERDVMPSDDHLPAYLQQYIGKPMKSFFDDVLTDKFRHAVAHFATDIGVLHVSSAAELDTYASLAFVTDLCVRILITSHERLLAQFESQPL